MIYCGLLCPLLVTVINFQALPETAMLRYFPLKIVLMLFVGTLHTFALTYYTNEQDFLLSFRYQSTGLWGFFGDCIWWWSCYVLRLYDYIELIHCTKISYLLMNCRTTADTMTSRMLGTRLTMTSSVSRDNSVSTRKRRGGKVGTGWSVVSRVGVRRSTAQRLACLNCRRGMTQPCCPDCCCHQNAVQAWVHR